MDVENEKMTDFGQVMAQSKANSAGLEELRQEVRSNNRDIVSRLERLNDKIGEKTQPNYANIWAGVSALLMIFIALSGAMFYHFNQRFAVQDENRRETFHQLNTRTERLENNADEQLKDDAKRYKDLLQEKLSETKGEK